MFQWRETEFCNKMLKHHYLCRGEETTSPKKMVDSTIIVENGNRALQTFVVPVTENSTGTALLSFLFGRFLCIECLVATVNGCNL